MVHSLLVWVIRFSFGWNIVSMLLLLILKMLECQLQLQKQTSSWCQTSRRLNEPSGSCVSVKSSLFIRRWSTFSTHRTAEHCHKSCDGCFNDVVWMTPPFSGEPASSPAAWISTCTWSGAGMRAATSPAWSPTTWRLMSGTMCRRCRSLWPPMRERCTTARSTSQVRRDPGARWAGGLTKPDEAACRQRRRMRRILSLFITAPRALIQHEAQTLTLIQIKANDCWQTGIRMGSLGVDLPTWWDATDTQIKAVLHSSLRKGIWCLILFSLF